MSKNKNIYVKRACGLDRVALEKNEKYCSVKEKEKKMLPTIYFYINFI